VSRRRSGVQAGSRDVAALGIAPKMTMSCELILDAGLRRQCHGRDPPERLGDLRAGRPRWPYEVMGVRHAAQDELVALADRGFDDSRRLSAGVAASRSPIWRLASTCSKEW